MTCIIEGIAEGTKVLLGGTPNRLGLDERANLHQKSPDPPQENVIRLWMTRIIGDIAEGTTVLLEGTPNLLGLDGKANHHKKSPDLLPEIGRRYLLPLLKKRETYLVEE